MRANRSKQSLPERPRIGHQAGVGLIEVLIAVLVLSFGMLGLAGLQLWSLKNNQSAMSRGLAVVQMHSIIDAMRADRTAAMNNAFNLDFTIPEPGTSFAATALTAWVENLRAELGTEARGAIQCNGADCTIRVRWNDQRGTQTEDVDPRNPDPMQTIETRVQL